MDANKFISENKVPIIIGGILIIVAILYFTGAKPKGGSNKPSGDKEGEDKKGGIIFPKGEDHLDFTIQTQKSIGSDKKITAILRYFKDKRFKIVISQTGETEKNIDRGTWRQDGLLLAFEDGKTFQGSSVKDILPKLKHLTPVAIYMDAGMFIV